MCNYIAKEQNEERNLKRIAAQRTIYSKAKMIFGFQLFLSGPIVMILTALSIYNRDFLPTVNMYSIVLSFLEILLFSRLITNMKKTAASIQEDFDCDVLRIPWNRIIVSDRPTHEQVNANSKNMIEEPDGKAGIMNWYNNFSEKIPYNAARIVIQKYNTNWDMELRKSFSNMLNGVSVFIILSILFMSSINKISVPDLIQMLLPIFPMAILLVNYNANNKSATKNLSDLKAVLDDAWFDVLQSKSNAEKLGYISRSIQDGIYLHRIGSPLIFDWFYNCKRKRQQTNADYLVDQLLKEYMSTH